MQQSSEILKVDNLTISFGKDNPVTVVRNLSFTLHKGKTLAVVGESGSGKSITALALMGLLPKTATVQGNIDIAHAGTEKKMQGGVAGMVFQEPMSSLNPVMEVGRQVAESVMLHQRVDERTAKSVTISWFDKVKLPQPEKLYKRYPHQLSGGQKQRVMIAMAMCNNPGLLIADEPTTALDVTVQQEIISLMADLQKDYGTAIMFITHDLALAARIADDMLVMQKGVAIEYGKSKDILHNPQQLYTKALLACRPTPGKKGMRLASVADYLQQVETKDSYSTPGTPGEVMLRAEDLKIWFTVETNWMGRPRQHYKAVDGVSFTLRQGEILGLVGESGCGKSTLSQGLVGLLPIYNGHVYFDGKDLAALNASGWKEVRRKMQMIFQDPYASLNPRMNVQDMLTEPMAVHNIVPRGQRLKEALRLLDMVQLPVDSLKRYPHQFSGGQRQRLGIARALALRPQVLICDESVSALDVSIQAQVLNLLKDLQRELNLSLLFISHDLNVVHYISDRVMVMQTGKIVETGPADKVLLHPEDDYTKRLIAAIP